MQRLRDVKGVAYLPAAPSNIWVQPIDGKPATQLTHFDDGREISDFAWSRDGKQLAIIRSSATTDIVLFTGLRK